MGNINKAYLCASNPRDGDQTRTQCLPTVLCRAFPGRMDALSGDVNQQERRYGGSFPSRLPYPGAGFYKI